MKCVHLIVSGRVQGVFFKDNTRRKAIELGLNGYAKNLPNGNVEVVAEGDEDKLKDFIDFIRKGLEAKLEQCCFQISLFLQLAY